MSGHEVAKSPVRALMPGEESIVDVTGFDVVGWGPALGLGSARRACFSAVALSPAANGILCMTLFAFITIFGLRSGLLLLQFDRLHLARTVPPSETAGIYFSGIGKTNNALTVDIARVWASP